MKTFIMSVVVSLLLMAGFSNISFGQDRDDRARVRTNVTAGTPNVRLHYSNYPRGYYRDGYYHRYRYREHPYYQRVYYREPRYWVPGHYNRFGEWVPGYWR